MNLFKICTNFLILLLTISIHANCQAEYFKDVIVTGTDGIWTDSRAYNTLQDAITAIGITRQEIVVAKEEVCTNLTIPSNIHLKFARGGSIANSGLLTINGFIDEDPHQIFTGSGNVQFGGGLVKKIYPQWWGATGDGITDDSDAVQSALDAIPRGTIFFPNGTYSIMNVSLTNKDNITLAGEGPSSILQLSAAGTGARMLYIDGCSGVTVQNLKIDLNNVGGPGADVTRGIYICNSSHNILVTDCYFCNGPFESSALNVVSRMGHICYNIVVDSCIFSDLDVGFICFGGKHIIASNNAARNIISEAISYWTDGVTYEFNYDCQAVGNTVENVTGGRAIFFKSCKGFSCCSNTMKTLVNGGVCLWNCSDGVIADNVIRSYASVCYGGAIEEIADSGTIENIIITGNILVDAVCVTSYPRGVSFWNTIAPKNNIVINDNYIDGTYYGILLQNTTDALISGNMITDIDGTGIRVANTNDSICVTDNKVWDAATAIWAEPGNTKVFDNFTDDASVSVFADADATPAVNGNNMRGNVFETFTNILTITDFDDGYVGQEITVISKAAITFDTTTAQDADHNLDGSSANIVTASGDITRWICEDGTTWRLIAFVDASADNSGGA